MRGLIVWVAIAVALAVAGGGCRKDKAGAASLNVRTTMPEGVEVTLVSLDRPGTYVERAKTDLGGALSFSGIKPGKYALVYQFLAYDHVPTSVPYNYGESQPVDVKTGRNICEWAVDTGAVSRVENEAVIRGRR